MSLRRSTIGWADYSGGDLNFIIGCTPVSEACATKKRVHCYAARWAKRCGRDFSDVTIYWEKLRRLSKAAWEPGDVPYRRGPGSKPIMFPVDLGDLFHDDVPTEMIFAALNIFAARDDADWVLLTKRPHRMLDITDHWLNYNELEWLPSNIWCLITVENQRRVDERIPILLQVKAQVRGVSMEPMLEPINVTPYLANNSLYKAGHYAGRFCYHGEQQKDGSIIAICDDGTRFYDGVNLHWIILGAESGPNCRPFNKDWATQVRDQCGDVGVPFFYKQSSGLYPGTNPYLDGQLIQEFPKT